MYIPRDSVRARAFGSERAKEFKTKNLRDFFQNGLLLVNVNEKVIDSMMGWKKESAKQHYYISQEVILSAYEQAKDYYSVDGGRQTSDQIARLERKVGQITVQSESRADEFEAMKKELESMRRWRDGYVGRYKAILERWKKEGEPDDDMVEVEPGYYMDRESAIREGRIKDKE